MCIDCNEEGVTRRAFLNSATAALAAAALGSKTLARQVSQPKALDDPKIAHSIVTFKSGTDTIKGYLARPKGKGRHRAILVLHGNAGLPESVRETAARLAQAGYAGLVLDTNSRVVPDSTKLDKPLEYYRSNTFDKQVTQDSLAAIEYMKAQPFVQRGGLGAVGFCGGGRKALMLSTESKDLKAVVAFYAPVLYRQFRIPGDPMPDVMDVVGKIRVPVEGHYGLLDKVAPAADARQFEQALRRQGTPVEMFYYEGAGHGFYDYSWQPEEGGIFGYNMEAALSSHRRMLEFLKRRLK
ncbi:MAG TPA: dienelactone hydrolase family protein [Pyrinomonadaceae bacterium]|nr:dienelactone hydrolase family protein [Pyrinomonadaceae bacterium]